MNLQTYGRNLMEVLAERSLSAIRGTSVDDVRRILTNAMPGRTHPAAQVGAAMGAFAVGAALGAGLTALYTPTSGPQLRKKLTVSARDARKQAMEMGETVRAQVDDARTTLARGVGQVSTAVGLASPTPSRRATKRRANGQTRPTRRPRASNHARAHT
jgi:hypothetical protein